MGEVREGGERVGGKIRRGEVIVSGGGERLKGERGRGNRNGRERLLRIRFNSTRSGSYNGYVCFTY